MLRKRIRELDIPLWARDRACTTSRAATNCSDELRHQLTQVVHGYTGRCDEDTARKGMEWMRARYRELGQMPPF